MNKTACFGFPFLFITLVGLSILKKVGQIHPLVKVYDLRKGELDWMVVLEHHHSFFMKGSFV